MNNPLPCIVCNKKLESAIDGASNQPHKGTTFMTLGHYGSTFFDPMDFTWLEVNICDECLVKAQKDQKILHYTASDRFELYK